jgi:hypothetical protein
VLRMEEAKGMGRGEAKGGEGAIVEGRGARVSVFRPATYQGEYPR